MPAIQVQKHPSSTFFFFNDTATTEIYTLSLHDALPILHHFVSESLRQLPSPTFVCDRQGRSEEHTSELQSHLNLVCRLLLEKKKNENSRPSTGPDQEQSGSPDQKRVWHNHRQP